MKKFLTSLIALSFILVSGATVKHSENVNAETAATSLTVGCKSAYLVDSVSGECIYKENEKARMPIASVCKVMTLTLCFDAVNEGRLSFDDEITVSDNAAGMGGSQVFLQSGCKYSLSQLVKSIIVCSANDSCVAVSEAIAGSEEAFVAKMNEKAASLNCTDTLFANCTGLPRETQYSCAADVAKMFAELIKHEDYFKYSKIWLEDFTHPDSRLTSMTNTNKLIRKYNSCDGGKTGFTNEAGFCLAATAKQNNLRLISVVLGADSSDNRFNSTVNMFNYGFANYKNKIVLDKEIPLNDELPVYGGKKDSCIVYPERYCYVFSAIDKNPEISYKISENKLKAPVMKGDAVGTIEIYKDNVLYDRVNLVSGEDILKAGYGDYLKFNAENWAL